MGSGDIRIEGGDNIDKCHDNKADESLCRIDAPCESDLNPCHAASAAEICSQPPDQLKKNVQIEIEGMNP